MCRSSHVRAEFFRPEKQVFHRIDRNVGSFHNHFSRNVPQLFIPFSVIGVMPICQPCLRNALYFDCPFQYFIVHSSHL